MNQKRILKFDHSSLFATIFLLRNIQLSTHYGLYHSSLQPSYHCLGSLNEFDNRIGLDYNEKQ